MILFKKNDFISDKSLISVISPTYKYVYTKQDYPSFVSYSSGKAFYGVHQSAVAHDAPSVVPKNNADV